MEYVARAAPVGGVFYGGTVSSFFQSILYLDFLCRYVMLTRCIYMLFFQLYTCCRAPHYSIIQMSNREDSVYLAKLAEQAERYEGTFLSFYDT